jgi:ubiquinone/menaquinone biosynthesis C-methylase UbiE
MQIHGLASSILFDVGALPYAVMTSQPAWRANGGALAAHAEVKAKDRVLDLGCGAGESAFGMVRRVPGVSVTGLDLSRSMIRFARARQKFDRDAAGTTFVEGDAMSLSFDDASFDAVTGHSFLYLVPDVDRVLAEVRRVLVPGGRCVFLEPAAVDGPLLPAEIKSRTLKEPRFVLSMALWRMVSRGYGRFDEARFRSSFEKAGLELLGTEPTLEGLGVFGIGRRPAAR